MKRKVLKRNVERTLIGINMIIALSTVMIEDFELEAIPFIAAAWGIFAFNAWTLGKYGRYEI